jgi:hypothetical protein
MALKAMSMFSGNLFSDGMKIMFANSFDWIYNGMRQAILHGAFTGETSMTTKTLKLTHAAKGYNYVSKSELQFSFVSLEDMQQLVTWINNMPFEGKLVATATTDTGEYRFIADTRKYGQFQEVYAAFMRWIRFVFDDMFVDE